MRMECILHRKRIRKTSHFSSERCKEGENKMKYFKLFPENTKQSKNTKLEFHIQKKK
jgi:hypothetical protein